MPRAIPESRFQDLIAAATGVFLEQGYRRTQIADVAARMGVAKGSMYTYVESKEALFDCVLRHADRADRIAIPDALPVPTPPPRATLALVQKRLAEEGAFPELNAALARARARDLRAELECVLGEIYDVLAAHRTVIKLIDRCAADYPELAQLWYRRGRQAVLSLIASYLDARAGRGRMRRFADRDVTARILLETLVFWAVHRHWDPSPQAVDEASVRRTVVAFLIGAVTSD